ncbi:hypothetical protein CRM22_002968 [Opisthorchis felineus]|uniref:SAP domain-containing protein n=1 Tax=Opisthorchis felineus TaxID=147828 RepID=A0A4S2M3I8_OPIFE|nr:hypothetical protein CRM22_002968 [Opisthorchis felineus]
MIDSDEGWVDAVGHCSSALHVIFSPEKKTEFEATPAADATEDGTSVVYANMDVGNEKNTSSPMLSTCYSTLDANALKVDELQNEMAVRKTDTKGLKVNMVARLQATLDEE